MMIDLDHFKQINDKYGHFAGDQVLKAFTAKVQKTLMQGEVFVRFGGEEFVLISLQYDDLGAQEKATALNDLARDMTVHVNNQAIRFTLSIGVFLSQDLSMTPDQMIIHADQNLYEAKANGRDRYVQSTKS